MQVSIGNDVHFLLNGPSAYWSLLKPQQDYKYKKKQTNIEHDTGAVVRVPWKLLFKPNVASSFFF